VGNEIEEEPAKKYKIRESGEHWYLVFSQFAMMSFYPDETGSDNKDLKALLNFACRISSKALSKKPVTLKIVEEQLRKSSYGLKCITDKIADALSHYRKSIGDFEE